MGAILDTPHTEKTSEIGNGNGIRFGLSSMQGWRLEMEDAHTVQIGLGPELPEWSFFAVFDGHAGAYVSAYCAKNLLNAILKPELIGYALETSKQSEHQNGTPSAENGNSEKTLDDGDTDLSNEKALQKIKECIRKGFLQLDEAMRLLPEVQAGDISGSTAVCCLISPKYLFFANCGDSRAVLSRDAQAYFSTQDHKPANPEEKDRIQRAGGTVMIQRVNGSLAVSRALGDFQYKQVHGLGPCEQLVSPEPEITIHPRSEFDEFLILACDGIWDVMSNEELCSFVRHQMKLYDNLETVCSSVLDTCLHKGSTDNMSIVLVAFDGAPKVDEQTQKIDKELNEKITEAVNCM